jgi:hypothetical protein
MSMEKLRPPVLAGYDAVMVCIREMHKAKVGHEHGSRTWLATKLGVSRQSLDNWRKSGFPRKFVPKVAKITGLDPAIVRPDTVDLSMVKTAYETLPSEWKDQSIIITNQRNRHG